MARRRNIRRLLFLGHRYIGVGCALFVVMLAVTGLMLNHTEEIKMDERYVQSPTIHNWYGIEAPEIGDSYRLDDHWLSEFGSKLYFNHVAVTNSESPLLGAIEFGEFYIAAYSNELILLTPEGKLVERINRGYGLPESITHLGVDTEQLLPMIRTTAGDFVGDSELFEWQLSEVGQVVWSKSENLPATLEQEILCSYRGDGLTLERMVLDLHSGRIAGDLGVFVMAVVAFLFLLLAAMGVWMWARR